MPRTAIAIQTPPGKYPATDLSANAADFTWGSSDLSNGNSIVSTGHELLLLRNDQAGEQTVTIDSVADTKNRTGHITTYSVGIGEYAWLGPFPVEGWKQSDGTVHVNTSHDDLKVAVVRLPALP